MRTGTTAGWVQRLLVSVCLTLVTVDPSRAGNEAQSTLRLGADIPFEYLADAEATLGVEAVANSPASDFTQADKPLQLGYTKHPIWLRTVIPTHQLTEPSLWLHITPPYLDRVSVFQRAAGTDQPFTKLTLGDQIPAENRPVRHRHLVFPITRPALAGVELIIRVQTSSSLILDARLDAPAQLASKMLGDNLFWGAYFTLAALSTVLALIVGALTGNRILLAVAATCPVYILVAGVQGYLPLVMPTGLYWLGDQLVGIALLVGYAGILWLGRAGLELHQHRPGLDRISRWLGISAIIASLSVPLGLYSEVGPPTMLVIEVFKLLSCLSVMPIARHRGMAYRMILGGYMAHSFTTMAALLVTFGALPANPLVYEAWQYALVLIMLVIFGAAVARLYHDHQDRRRQEDLERELRREREVGFQQRQFMGMLAHEYRNPLAVIEVTTMNMLHTPPDTAEELGERVSRIQRSARRMTQLVDTCLADARVAASLKLQDTTEIDLGALIQSAADIALSAEDQSITYRVSPTGPVIIQGDAALLRIAISNLLDNAVKFSTRGHIGVDIESKVDYTRISFWNDGWQIPKEEWSVIFERFRQGSNANHEHRGSGLGLFVTAQIVQAHGGDIFVGRSDAALTELVAWLPTRQPDRRIKQDDGRIA